MQREISNPEVKKKYKTLIQSFILLNLNLFHSTTSKQSKWQVFNSDKVLIVILSKHLLLIKKKIQCD